MAHAIRAAGAAVVIRAVGLPVRIGHVAGMAQLAGGAGLWMGRRRAGFIAARGAVRVTVAGVTTRGNADVTEVRTGPVIVFNRMAGIALRGRGRMRRHAGFALR